MRLSRADVKLLQALEALRALLKTNPGDRELASFLRSLPSLRRSSPSVLAFLGGNLPVQLEGPPPRRKKGVIHD
jgi:hypothetical protein